MAGCAFVAALAFAAVGSPALAVLAALCCVAALRQD